VTSHGPYRSERVAALALVPGAAAIELEIAFGEIVDRAVAGDMRQRIGFLDIRRALADHNAELDFPVGLHRSARDHHGIVRPLKAAHRLGEEHRLGRDVEPGFGRVVGIVEADREELACPRHGHAEPGEPSTKGSEAGSMLFTCSIASTVRSAITPDRSRMRPSASSSPGFSSPRGPYLSSLMGVPQCV
jgi:hypothetical protein